MMPILESKEHGSYFTKLCNRDDMEEKEYLEDRI